MLSPLSPNTWVMPIFLPINASTIITLLELDLDVDAGGQIEAHQRIHRLRSGIAYVDQSLVGADLELLSRVLVLERAADHRIPVHLSRERNWTGDVCSGPLCCVDHV